MNARQRAAWPVVLSSLALVTTACINDGETSGQPQPSSATSTSQSTPPTAPDPTPSTSEPTTEPVTDRQAAVAGAKAAVRAYFRVTDTIAGQPGTSLDELQGVLIDPALTQQREYWERFRAQEFTSNGGSTAFEWIRVNRVDLFPKKQQGSITVAVCYNLDGIKTFDGDHDAVDAISPGLATYEVYNYDYPNQSEWFVAVENSAGKGCRS